MERPQYAKDYEERFIQGWPVMVQPKLDGVRCMTEVAETQGRKGVLGWKKPRAKKPLVTHKHHILTMLNTWLVAEEMPARLGSEQKGVPHTDLALDGELFTDQLDWFEDVVSGVQCPDSEYAPFIQYHIFDLMDPTRPFKHRYEHLKCWYSMLIIKHPDAAKWIKLVPVTVCHNIEELTALQEYNDKHFEGSIIRNPEGMYTFDKRNRDIMRWKFQKDAEFPIKDVVEGVGKNVGVATFVCYNPEVGGPDDPKAEFRPDSTGPRERRMKYFNDREQLIGKQATVLFQNMSKGGIPRFPKVKAVRDYE